MDRVPEARPEGEGALRGREGRVEMEKSVGQGHQKRGGDREDSERRPGRKTGEELHPNNSFLCLSATLLQRLGWGADTTSWGWWLSKAPQGH